MAKKSASKRRASSRTRYSKGRSSSKKGLNLGKFTLGMLILIVLGYVGLALNEGRLVPKVLEEIELPSFDNADKAVEPTTTEDSTTSTPEIVEQSESETIDPAKYDDFDLYFTAAFDFMWPAYETGQAIIERPYYTLRYSEPHEQAIWVAYKLSADSLKQEKFERKNDFRKDPRVRTGSATLSDYKGSGYDRGHLAPAADFSYDEFALSQSFYMSNMSPQVPGFNRGIWKNLEEQVRNWASEHTELYVITGPVLNNNLKSIGKEEVSIPEYYYKVILDIKKPGIKAIAFLLKNEKSASDLSTHVVSIDRIEELTGLDFFPTIPEDLENSLEMRITKELWFD
ncbi:DNA/RNA non-specific endonuclease [Roseivirga misakiensis]|uniref:DNA/RNA non-specific endonuclease n=1 Tax=Roseivirga misakiensis TaxID=1563681 RepID=UPI000B489E94|nr:DNA/RNA non-specific endonuclease [Roseivirga misakiensis]